MGPKPEILNGRIYGTTRASSHFCILGRVPIRELPSFWGHVLTSAERHSQWAGKTKTAMRNVGDIAIVHVIRQKGTF